MYTRVISVRISHTGEQPGERLFGFLRIDKMEAIYLLRGLKRGAT